ncbi:MAG: hypothetical protein EA341_08045 [Mongoliibacter sp.]|uniref:hypothetical protein n=1 Tax=Mongoliibacter sp. TaxID=2022438 RepID=UPI0012F2F764|nr:hypothetical protein [Mongoliibacter sp.]TVP50180.1 MAG: hypothetical protein EA341_08045 [Mongoliibacter sp.]
MQIPSLAALKKELNFLSEKELIETVLELAKFNRDNKAFLYFKLFERGNPRIFIEMVKDDLDISFMDANTRNYHVAKKSAQAIRRKLNKNLKLSKDKTAHIELIIHFCKQMKVYGFLEYRHPVIENLYKIQIGKVEKLIAGLHEDLQYDYQLILEELA